MILGTAAYMSPEQAKGFEADQRSDLFSFGCLLYELLTGRPAFDGDTVSDILASVLKSDVDLTALPPRLHPRLVELLRRCLEKNPKKRWHAAADVRVELESLSERPVVVEETPRVATAPQARWTRVLSIVAAALAGAAVAGFAAWTLKPALAPTIARFAVTLPEGSAFTNTSRRFVDLSPDGTRMAYAANQRIYIRDLGALAPRVLVDERPALVGNPTFGPDGESLAYTEIGAADAVAEGFARVKRVPVSGGAAFTICDVDAIFGLRWDEHGIVIGQGPKGIARVSPDGGVPEVLVAARAGEYLGSPQILPGGRAVLYTVKKVEETWESGQIAVQPLGGERKILVAGLDGRYLPSGHLVFLQSGVLLAVRFDLDRLAVTGGPVPLVEGVRRSVNSNASGSAQMGISTSGSLLYAPGLVSSELAGSDLALFDRKGGNQPLKLPPASYRAPRVSPDGRLVAFEGESANQAALWIYELSGANAPRRLTFDGSNRAPTWSPDGQWIAFQSDREGDRAIFRQRADGSGAAERLSKPEQGDEHTPQDWSRTGEHLLLTVRRDRQVTLMTMRLKDRTLEPFADARSTAMINAVFSPDGRWIAYQGRDGAGNVVYVQPFPPTGAKYLLPRPGAGHPVWSPTGNEILVNYAPRLSAIVAVKTTPAFAFGPPAEFPRVGRVEPNPATDPTNVDFMPDGERIIGVLPPSGSGSSPTANELVVVLNWDQELKQRLPQ